MRLLLAVAALALLAPAAEAAKAKPATPAAPKEETWIAACFGEDTQFTQVVGGKGFFHVSNGNRTYDTQKMVQAFYNGKQICSVPDPKAPVATSDVAFVCADKDAKMVSVLYRSEAANQPARPSSASPYCKARIDIIKE